MSVFVLTCNYVRTAGKEEISRQQKAKKDNQAQTGKKKTIVAEKSKEARAESKKINIESEFAFILWEKGAVKFCLPSCREKTELFVLD